MPNDILDLRNDDSTTPVRDPMSRYFGGVDRWDYDALARWEICCSASNCMTMVMEPRGYIWWWSYDDQIWWQHDSITSKLIKGENELFVCRLRLALPLINSFIEAKLETEKEAAYIGLTELALSVNGAFRRSPDDAGIVITASFLYSSATKDQRWQIADLHPPDYSEVVWKDLRDREDDLRKILSHESWVAMEKRKPAGSALGDKLRGLEAARVETEMRSERREATQKYFEDIKRQVAKYIEAGEVPPRFMVPHEHQAAWGSGSPNSDLFEEFCEWAHSERLTVLVGAWDIGQGNQVGLEIICAANSRWCAPFVPYVEKAFPSSKHTDRGGATEFSKSEGKQKSKLVCENQKALVDRLGFPPGIEDIEIDFPRSRNLPRAADFR